MEYRRVKQGHIVPKTYLRQWSVDGQLEMRRPRTTEWIRMATKDAGTRGPFYRRTRPDGTEIDDIEWSLGQIETVAGPILADIERAWPISPEDKAKLAEFLAVQLVRGPRWREWRERETRRCLDQIRQTGTFEEIAEHHGVEVDVVAQAHEDQFLSSTEVNVHMISVSRTVASILGSMIWSLVTFPRPVLATSDHPVVLWPLQTGTLAPAPMPVLGLANTLEFRVPVSPTAAILMTWRVKEGIDADPLEGKRHHVKNLNAFTLAAADKQAYRLPGSSAPTVSGQLHPLSAELVPSYESGVAAACPIRQKVGQRLNSKLGRRLAEEFEIVTAGSLSRDA